MDRETIKDSIAFLLVMLLVMYAIGTIERLMPDDISKYPKAEVHTETSR